VVSKRQVGLHLPQLLGLRIEASTLLDIIERHASDPSDVQITNTTDVFGGIADARKHVSLLAGNPQIEFDNVAIYFNGHGSGVSLRVLPATIELEAKARAIHRDLAGFAPRFFRTPYIRYLVGIALANVATYYAWYALSGVSRGSEFIDRFGVLLFVPLAISAAVLIPLLQRISMLGAVRHNPRSTFWERNRDKMLIGLGTAAAGAILGAVATYFLTNAR